MAEFVKNVKPKYAILVSGQFDTTVKFEIPASVKEARKELKELDRQLKQINLRKEKLKRFIEDWG